MVADDAKVFGVAVLRSAVKQNAMFASDRQQERWAVLAARLVDRAVAQDTAITLDRAADRLGNVRSIDVRYIHDNPRSRLARHIEALWLCSMLLHEPLVVGVVVRHRPGREVKIGCLRDQLCSFPAMFACNSVNGVDVSRKQGHQYDWWKAPTYFVHLVSHPANHAFDNS